LLNKNANGGSSLIKANDPGPVSLIYQGPTIIYVASQLMLFLRPYFLRLLLLLRPAFSGLQGQYQQNQGSGQGVDDNQ
jgi:hypothetical protein